MRGNEDFTLQKVGFFHFGAEDKARPVRSLIRALEASIECNGGRHVEHALIVLPEAFNIRTTYNNEPPIPRPSYDPGIKACLRMLAAEFRVVFVAGLIVEDSVEQVLPFSSAYFLGPQTCNPGAKAMGRSNGGPPLCAMRSVALTPLPV